MKRRYILLLSALILFTGAVIMTGCPAHVQPKTPKYKVTLNSGKHGSVTVKPALPADGMVEAHTRLSFTAQPDEGYEVDTWIMAAPRSADKKEAALTVAEKTTVTVTFKSKIKKYKIMLNKNEYGTVTVSPALPADGMVEQYKTLTFTATPNEGYEVEWTGAAPDNTNKNKATLTVTADAVVTATFKKPGNSAEVHNYHVALSSGNNGTLIADTPLPADGMVAAGSTLTFTATPDSAYEVEAWTEAVANPSDSTKATLTVTAHTTVAVTFKKKQADVTLLKISSSGYLQDIIDKDALIGDLIIPDTVIGSIPPYFFKNCHGLTSVTIPNGVTSIGYCAFKDCVNLTHVTIPDSVTKIEDWAFDGCSGLISITIPNEVTSIGFRAFRDCRKLTNIILPNSLTSIKTTAFENCKSLTKIIIPNKVTEIGGGAFKECSKLTQVSISNSVTAIEDSAFYYCTGLTNITLGTGVATLAPRVFCGCKNLTSIIIPNSVSKIGSWAFEHCDKLTSVTFENTAGWKVGTSKAIAPEDLADASKAAEYLRGTYCDETWTRN